MKRKEKEKNYIILSSSDLLKEKTVCFLISTKILKCVNRIYQWIRYLKRSLGNTKFQKRKQVAVR